MRNPFREAGIILGLGFLAGAVVMMLAVGLAEIVIGAL